MRQRERETQYWLEREKQRIEGTVSKLIVKILAAKVTEKYWSGNEELGDIVLVGVKERRGEENKNERNESQQE